MILNDLMTILTVLLVVISFISYGLVTPHLPTRFQDVCSQATIDRDKTGLVAKIKKGLVLSLVVSSISLGVVLTLMMIFSELSLFHAFSMIYVVILVLLRKRFIAAWKSKRPIYQLIEELEESSPLTKYALMFIGIGPLVVPFTWNMLTALSSVISMGSGM